MACGSQLLTMISFIIITTLLMIILFLSSQSTHILTLMNAAESDMYFMKQNDNFQVQKISGIDDNEMKQAYIVEKFRSLLGLKSFHKRVSSKSNADSTEFLSPSPSPAPSPSLLHLHPHLHHPTHHPHWNLQVKKPHHEDKGRDKRVIILVAVLVSLGVAALVGVFGLIFFCRKYTNHRKKPKRTMPLFTSSNSKGTKGTCKKNSSSKVSLNNGLDLFYLDALGEDVEQHASCSLRKTTTCDDDDDNNNVSCSFTKEIVSVHEEVELVKTDTEIVSDDESFHSFVDSISNVRLSNASNASACSLSDTQSLSPQNHQFPSSPQKTTLNTFSQQLPFSPKHEDKEVKHEIETSTSLPPPPPPSPPPPPPPTPPLQMPLFSLHSLTSSSRVSSHSPLSDTFSGSNLQSPEKESLSPSPSNPIKSSPSSIPPPPCPPPPFLKGKTNGAKTPPPPPSQFPQFTPLGKDGAPLPKLKPLHWDKVRAAPNRTMVWDKLRSSSFE